MDPSSLDTDAFRWCYDLALPRMLVVSITHLATAGGIWTLTGLGLLIFGRGRNRAAGATVVAGLVAQWLLVELSLKQMFSRVRPFAALDLELRDTWMDPESFSFPSGHSAMSFVAAWILGARFPKWRIPLLLLAAMIAASRVHLGAHYPSDVLVGALLGIGLGATCTALARVWTKAASCPD